MPLPKIAHYNQTVCTIVRELLSMLLRSSLICTLNSAFYLMVHDFFFRFSQKMLFLPVADRNIRRVCAATRMLLLSIFVALYFKKKKLFSFEQVYSYY